MINSDYVTGSIEELPEERRLVWEAKSGNTDAFVQLYDAYVERLYRYIYFRVSDDTAAETITSRVFIKAWEYLGHYPIILSSFFTWLCKIARNQVTEYYRIHVRVPAVEDGIALVAAEPAALDEKVQDLFDLQAMRDALQFLTEEQRQVLILKFIAGLPAEAIARMMVRRESTIRALEMSALQVLARIDARKSSNRADFQRIVEACLTGIMEGTSTAQEWFALYPEYAAQLKPLLRTVLFLNLARAVKPSAAFGAHTRAKLVEYLRFHARQSNRKATLRRMALAMSIAVMALIATGTAHAQTALPGDTFYGWKRTSEEIWRAASLDPVATDIKIANRRVDEWVATADDPERNASALDGYSQVISRLEATEDTETLARVLPVIQKHQQILEDAGLSNSDLGTYVVAELQTLPAAVIPDVSLLQPTVTPVVEATAVAADVEPVVIPTELEPTATPEVVPTEIPPTAPPEPTSTPIPPTDVPTEIPPTATPEPDFSATPTPTSETPPPVN